MYTIGGCGTDLAPAGLSGLGCPDCGGKCGMNGLTMDGTGLFGTGIFGTGVTYTDPSTWGAWEWGTVAIGAFAILSMFDTSRRATSHVRERGRRIKGGFTSPISGGGSSRPKKKKKK
jgi:hypothetical protein